jgi:hypothetical protein
MTAASYPGVGQVITGRNRGTMYGLVGANQKIPVNAYVAIVGGYWTNVTSTTGLEGRVGKCLKDVDNTGGANGDKAIEVALLGGRNLELIANDVTSPVTQTDLGSECYWLDNATVTASNGLLAGLIARITDIKTQFLAHVVYTTGSVHGSADGASYTITTPTTEAQVYTACGQLQTAALAHVVNVSGSPAIHGAADTGAQGALSALVVPATLASAQAFIEAFAGIMFGATGHTKRTSPAVHGAADTTNVLTSSAASASRSRAGRAWAFYKVSLGDVDTSRVWVEVY